ncbi:MAG: ATP synthase subunit C [Thermofilum sp.]|uniref:ATPase n=1 Tax=Thermofilum pendens TaxID=2269 RepID=A0A7C4H3I9_THEPE
MMLKPRTLATAVLAAFGVAIMIASASVFAAVTIRTAQKMSPSAEAAGGLGLADAIAMLSAAIAVTSSTIASGIALRGVATAGFAAAAENPRLATWILIMGGLAEGIAIYGLLVAILILGKI